MKRSCPDSQIGLFAPDSAFIKSLSYKDVLQVMWTDAGFLVEYIYHSKPQNDLP